MKETYTIGVDPGCSGALVLLNESKYPVEWTRMPVMKVGNATRVNTTELANWFREILSNPDMEVGMAYVEQVHSMPGQGVSSTFSFGHSCGCVMGVLGTLQIPYTMVSPQKWKKVAGLIGMDKDASRALAIGFWPSWSELHKKAQGQAYADAALISAYGSL